jgi:hypothetical protein
LINPFLCRLSGGLCSRNGALRPAFSAVLATFLQQDSLYVALQQNAKRISHEME